MTYALNLWYAAIWNDDLPSGELVARTICEQPVVMYRNGSGTPIALEDRCAHRFVPLSMGALCDNATTVECPYHGLQYDETGACVVNPHGSGRIPATLRVKAFPLVERHTMLWIWLGSGEPDESLIPDFSYLDPGAEGIMSKRDYMEMPVDYQLMIDNLLDLSHASFLHRGSLGNEGTARAQVLIDQGERSVTVSRLSPNIDPPPIFDLMFRNDGAPIDFWSVMRWDAPALLRHDAGAHAPGDTREQGITVIGTHLVTPSSKGRCHYHIAAVRRGDSASDNDEQVAAQLSALRRYAFEEQDRPILEAQQRAYDLAGGPDSLRPVMLSIDSGPLRARRVLARMIDQETRRTAGAGPAADELGDLAFDDDGVDDVPVVVRSR